MARPVTLFTGQWADLSLAELAPLAKSMGYDGLELACWGDHFNVQEALQSERYVADKRRLLEQHGDCDRARNEVAAAEQICREALADVRQTIRKYREESRQEQGRATQGHIDHVTG